MYTEYQHAHTDQVTDPTECQQGDRHYMMDSHLPEILNDKRKLEVRE